MTEHAWSRWPVVVAVATGTLLTGVTLGFGLASGIGWQQFVESYTLTNLVIGLAFLASGAPVAWLTRNVVGPLLIAAGLCHLISAAATMMAVFGLERGLADRHDPRPVDPLQRTVAARHWSVFPARAAAVPRRAPAKPKVGCGWPG